MKNPTGYGAVLEWYLMHLFHKGTKIKPFPKNVLRPSCTECNIFSCHWFFVVVHEGKILIN